MIRKILAVIGGLIAGGLTISLIEFLGRPLHPLPEGINTNDMTALAAHAKNAPLSSKVVILLGWALGASIAGYISTIIARNGKKTYAMICAILFIISTIINLSMIPSPVWFWIMGLLVWIPLALLGYRLASKNKS